LKRTLTVPKKFKMKPMIATIKFTYSAPIKNATKCIKKRANKRSYGNTARFDYLRGILSEKYIEDNRWQITYDGHGTKYRSTAYS